MGRWILGNSGHGGRPSWRSCAGRSGPRTRSQCADLLLLPHFTQGVQQHGPMGSRQWPETEPRRIDNRHHRPRVNNALDKQFAAPEPGS